MIILRIGKDTNNCMLLVRMQHGAPPWKVLITYQTLNCAFPGHYPREMKFCAQTFIVVHSDQAWRPSECSSAPVWISRLWFSCILEHGSAMRNELLMSTVS